MNRRGRNWWGLLFIGLGLLFLLDNYFDIDLGDIIANFWPLLLVFWGVHILMRRDSEPDEIRVEMASWESSSHRDTEAQTSNIHASKIMGDFKFQAHSPSFSGGSISTNIGDIDLDLTASTLAEGDHELSLRGVIGDITIKVPADFELMMTARTTIGDLDLLGRKRDGLSPSLRYETPGFVSASRRLRIDASLVMGDIALRSPESGQVG